MDEDDEDDKDDLDDDDVADDLDELVCDECDADELVVAGLALDDDEFRLLVLDEDEFLLLVLDGLEDDELDELDELDPLEDVCDDRERLVVETLDTEVDVSELTEDDDDMVDLDRDELDDRVLTEVWLDWVVSEVVDGLTVELRLDAVEREDSMSSLDDIDDGDDTELTLDADEGELPDDTLLETEEALLADEMDDAELLLDDKTHVEEDDELLLRDSSTSANTLTESPTLRMNGPSMETLAVVLPVAAAWTVAIPPMDDDSSYWRSMVPRLNLSPIEWTMTGFSSWSTISTGLLPPVPPSRSCSMTSSLMTCIADDGTTTEWLTIADVMGYPVSTEMLPSAAIRVSTVPVIGGLSDRFRLYLLFISCPAWRRR